MSGLTPGSVHGEWIFEQEIGSGGFGLVTAWKRQKTHEMLVIKQCRQPLDDNTRGRWLDEINLMNSNNHKNLVSGRPIPKDIQQALRHGIQPLLGLEYCEGDLRKLLSKDPFHCCGLRERTVIDILQDVSSGLEFLHNTRIYHRDLKPENILLSYNGNKTTFKITDLGYAKQMDIQSVAMSFVGTVQYLAPELYEGNGYTCTADYWSFGTVMFECITGHRPFTLSDQPLVWYNLIQNKSDKEIWGNVVKDKPVFYTDIPKPNHVCRIYLDVFRAWFQLVLRFDPKKRGSTPIDETGTLDFFVRINHILDLKILHVVDVLTCTDVAYLCQPGDTGLQLKQFLQDQTKIAVEDQFLIFNSGSSIDNDYVLDECAKTLTNGDVLFLFSTSTRAQGLVKTIMPELVRELMGSPEEEQGLLVLKQSWAHALYYCNQTATEYKQLQQGLVALVLNTMEFCNKCDQLKDDLIKSVTKLKTVVSVFEESYNFDVKFFNTEDEQSHEERRCIGLWQECLLEIRSFMGSTNVIDLLTTLKAVQNQISKYKEETKRIKEDRESDFLQQLAKEAEDKYEKLRRKINHQKEAAKTTKHNSRQISEIVMQCAEKRQTMFQDFYKDLRKLTVMRDEMSTVMQAIQDKTNRFEEKYETTMKYQLERQRKLWELFNFEIKRAEVSSLGSSAPTSLLPSSLTDLVSAKSEEEEQEGVPAVDDVKQDLEDKWKKLDVLMESPLVIDTSLPVSKTKENEPLPPSPILSPVKSSLMRGFTIDCSPLTKEFPNEAEELSKFPRRWSEAAVSGILAISSKPKAKVLPTYTEVKHPPEMQHPAMQPTGWNYPYHTDHQPHSMEPVAGHDPEANNQYLPPDYQAYPYGYNESSTAPTRPSSERYMPHTNRDMLHDMQPNGISYGSPHTKNEMADRLGNQRIFNQSSDTVSTHRDYVDTSSPSKPAVLKIYENVPPSLTPPLQHLRSTSPRWDRDGFSERISPKPMHPRQLEVYSTSPKYHRPHHIILNDRPNDEKQAFFDQRVPTNRANVYPTERKNQNYPAHHHDISSPHQQEYRIYEPHPPMYRDQEIINESFVKSSQPSSNRSVANREGKPHLDSMVLGGRQTTQYDHVSRQTTHYDHGSRQATQYDRHMMPLKHNPTSSSYGYR